MSTEVPSLVTFLTAIPEFRKAQGKRFSLLSLLLYVCVAMLCGRRSQSAIAEWGQDYGPLWLQRLGLERAHGPSQSTIHRLFKGISREQVEQALSRWAEAVLAHTPPVSRARARTPRPALEGIAIDGKALRGSRQRGAVDAQLLSALSQRLAIVLGQVTVQDDRDERSAMEPLFNLIGLAGRVITTDALHTQRATAQAILGREGDYVQVVKDNQPTLLEDIQTVFDHAQEVRETIDEASTLNWHGQRVERRHMWTSTLLAGFSDWPGLQQVLKLERVTLDRRTGTTRREVAYGVTSLSRDRASAAQLLKLWREHWFIENKLHYVRDVTFDEDRAPVRTAHIPHVMAAFRNVTLSLLRLAGWTNIAAACRRYAAQPALALKVLGLKL